MQQIAVEDIGTFAAAVIERRDAVFGRRFDIAGDDLTGDESAAILSEAADRDIHYKGVSPAFWRSQNNEDMASGSRRQATWPISTAYAANSPKYTGMISRHG